MEILENDMVRLSSFSAMAHDIAQSRTLAETIDRVMHHIGTVFNPLSWSLLLRDSQSGSLKFVHATGPGSQAIRGLVLARGQGVAGWVAERAESLLIADAAHDERFHAGVDEVTGFVTKSIIAVPLRARKQVYGVIELINKLDESPFDDRELIVLQTIADFAAIAVERAYYHRTVERLALTDDLTGLHNRRSFHQVLNHEVEKTKRDGTLFALLVIDIDHFKSINDRFGHAAGDEALRHVARIMKSTARKVDLCTRLGGDEFAILMPGAVEADPPFLVRRLQRSLDEYNRDASVPIALSIGARLVDPRHPESIMTEADEAMYRAKGQPLDPSREIEDQLSSWLDEPEKD